MKTNENILKKGFEWDADSSAQSHNSSKNGIKNIVIIIEIIFEWAN